MATHGLWTGQTAYIPDSFTADNWWLDGSYTAPPTLNLRDTVINSVHTDNWWSGRVNVFGPSTISNGIHVGAFSGFVIDLQRAAGTLDLNGNSSVGYHTHFSAVGYSTINVNGTLSLHGANTSINDNVGGSGNIVLSGKPDILPGANEGFSNTEFGASVGSGDTIWCLEGRLQFDKPQLIGATIEGVGDGITLAGIGTLADVKLTATDFTATSILYNNDGSIAGMSGIDLHLRDTPNHQVVMTHFGGGNASGGVVLTAAADTRNSLPQIVVQQT